MDDNSGSGMLAVREQWQLAVGRFLLSFGEVESVISSLIVDLPSERIFESVGFSRLSSRIRLVRQILSQRGLPDELVSRLDAVLAEVSSLSKDRNVVAHNPLYWSFFDSAGNAKVEINIFPFLKPEKRISLARLQTLGAMADSLSERIHILYGEVSDALAG